ncbi:hypothetical protein [Xanthomonas rydalmerensis]|uniref:Uncharacterized protein n=1 Tax=Xanthomonas rydalmerensis TaxID=3046274 RepID=A0ABZ0JSB5_9XANT|nr:hypothetical protein [Xanthomonas sp. DM-2023]WOS42632.1 hypothetical protein QN243_09400 [Xanthomonas sp. DM-2023]WOS46818.1 hypothetical protein QN242_09400 [Xanthomonas sp. DM-2023]WOS50998.1 hypothetical protein QN240_09400 [Xanthomonas sp. DM-2023]WOS55178.1 hypothetical protein QN244_09400 [Xanthomonas sp. DM-2023]WOS59360.1 hypothetical protein QN245_09400 [Xanthomonas sp. DM-2023]
MPTPYKPTQPLDAWKRPARPSSARREPHARADHGSPWAWMIVIALALAVAGWWLAVDRDDDGRSPRATPMTPANDPPRSQPPVH